MRILISHALASLPVRHSYSFAMTWSTNCPTRLVSTIIILLFLTMFRTADASISCYSCNSNQPGCDADGLGLYVQWYGTCPESDDRCVKIIETKKGDTTITRDCLSKLTPTRTDMPGDKYDGCRPAIPNPKIANHVSNNVREHDLKRASYDNVTFCFCSTDNYCNSSYSKRPSIYSDMIGLTISLAFIGRVLQRKFELH